MLIARYTALIAGQYLVMQAKRVPVDNTTKIVAILDPGDEAIASLQSLAREYEIVGASFQGIGAFEAVVLGYFDWDEKRYESVALDEQVEVLSLDGDVAIQENGEPQIHAHVVVGRRDGRAYGGHLIEGYVRPTLEFVIEPTPVELRRRSDPETGLALIDLSVSG